jgi:hypothetical protein
MAETSVVNALLIGAVGGGITAAIQYGFRRYGETQQQRREIVETHLLQLQNSAESLYYRSRNLLEKTGRSVMDPDYYVKTSAFALGRVLAHEQQLMAKGVYAKLNRSTRMKREIKARLHAINLTMDDREFLHYHRVRLAEMLLDEDGLISFGEFLKRWSDPAYSGPVTSVSEFVRKLPTEPSAERLGKIRDAAGELVLLLERETNVPSAMTLNVHLAK